VGPATARGVGEVIDSSSASICNFCLEIHLLGGRLCSYSKKGIFIIYDMWPKCLKNKKEREELL